MATSTIHANEIPPSAGWRFKLGIIILALAFGLWLLVPVAAALGVTATRIAAMTGAIFVANKVLLLTCVAVMGKPGFQQLKGMIFGYAKGLTPTGPISQTRHVVGLVMFCLPIVSAMLEPYVDQLWPGFRPNLWQAQLLGDLMLLASFFVLGGDFWAKVRSLFVRNTSPVGDAGAA